MKLPNCLNVRAHLTKHRLLALALATIWAPGAAAQQNDIVRIEEEWELVVARPDGNSTAPQVTCVTSPFSHVSSMHVTFEINHQSQPEFHPGGLSLQLWDGEFLLSSTSHPHDLVMASQNEVVRWTQVMSLEDGHLVFEIKHGTSQTWGDFGGTSSLRVSENSLLNHLNGYDPQMSVQSSGVGFAANRVTSLELKEVRAVTQSGQVLRDTTDRVVHALNE